MSVLAIILLVWATAMFAYVTYRVFTMFKDNGWH